MKLVSWSIVNNEIDYLADVIAYHLPWLDAMYVLDTGSTDGTWETLQKLASQNSKLIIERYHTQYIPEYNIPWEEMKSPFPEVEVRNYALQRCRQLCQPDWSIQLDGDEIFLSSVRSVIEHNTQAVALNHSTLNPVGELETHRVENRFNHCFYDPHSRVWNEKYQIHFIGNPGMAGKQFHCIPSLPRWNRHLFETPGTKWVREEFHLHLHWMYGKKMEGFWNNRGLRTKKDLIQNAPLNRFASLLPPIFQQRRKEWESEELS